MLEDEVKISFAVFAIPRLIERFCNAPHTIGEQPRLIEPSVELALNANLCLRRDAYAALNVSPVLRSINRRVVCFIT